MSYIEPPMNYTGSKFKLLEQLLPEFDKAKSTFVDVFCCGGSVQTNVLDKYEKVIANDIIIDLIGIHKGLLHSDEIITKTKELCPGKDNPVGYGTLRENYNGNPSPEGLWALMLSSTNNMVRFNQNLKYNQTFGKRSWNDSTQKKVNQEVEDMKNDLYRIEKLPMYMKILAEDNEQLKKDNEMLKKKVENLEFNMTVLIEKLHKRFNKS